MKKTKKIAPIAEKIIPPLMSIWIGDVKGLENLPKNRGFILAPNHSSYIEHMLLGCIIVPHINKKLHFIAKKEHFESTSQNFWHRIWSKYIGYIPIDRSNGEEALKHAEKYLRKGAVIVIYPEGTRTTTGKMQKGRTGVARLVLHSKVPVVPLGIRGTFEILPKGKRIPKLKKADFYFGKPLYFDKYYNKEVTKKVLREITNTIMKEIAKLANKKYNF